MRLSKYISEYGTVSRRNSEILIQSGKVKVNNKVILEPYYDVNCEIDNVTIDNITINSIKRPIYIALNKPAGYISDLKDDKKRDLARDLIDIEERLYPVGRLDYNSEGLMLFTNDGEFANIIMHPRYGVEKEYLIKIRGVISQDKMKRLKNGIRIDGAFCKADKVKFIKTAVKNNWYSIIVREGRNRMIRNMCLAIHHPVLKLVRVRIGKITLGTLEPGKYRKLKESEINFIKSKRDVINERTR